MTEASSNNINLGGKVAVVTGANRGIGKQICETFQSAGAHVIACARTQNEKFTNWVKSNNMSAVSLDLEDSLSIKSAIKEIRAISGNVDILVNNAGIGHGALFQMTKAADLRKVFEINFFAQIELSQGISRLMMRQQCGVIINISSSTARIADSGTLAYGSCKAALNRATQSMASELGVAGIRVNAIAPGVTETDMADQMDEAAREKLVSSSALKKAASPQDVANVALFVASDLASHITGQIISVDGGIV